MTGNAANSFDTDVLIVGAGPAGLALRLALEQLGIATLQVDRHAAGLNTSRAAVIHAHTLEVLEPYGVVPALLAHGLQVPQFCVREADAVLLEIGFAGLPSNYPYTLMCPQNRTEAILQARLDDLGARIERPARLAGLADHGDSVMANVEAADGAVRQVRSQWIVGCDGAHSSVRSLAGIGFAGDDYVETFVLADVRLASASPTSLSRQEVSLYFASAGLMVLAPLPEEDGGSTDRYRIVATLADAVDTPDIATLQALLAQRAPGLGADVTALLWSSSFHLQHRVASQVHQGRVLLCGDAAHVHSPAGGQGMNIGIQDAVALAAPLRAALDGNGTHAVEAWAHERHEVARGVVRMTDAMTRAATLASPMGRTVRNAVLGLVGRSAYLRERIALRLAELER